MAVIAVTVVLPSVSSLLLYLIAYRFLKFLYFAGAYDAVGLIIYVAIDLVAFASLHAYFLFAEGAEEVFHQSPVKVGTVFVCPFAFEVGELTHFDEGLFGGGYEAFFLVEIQENVEGVAHFCPLWHIAFGQENVANFSAFEIYSVVFLTQDFEEVPLA